VTAPVRVLVADDQPLMRAGFTTLINSAPDLRVAAEAGDGYEVLDALRATDIDVVLMDIRMPGLDGLAATRRITADAGLTGVRVLVLTTFGEDEYVVQALRAGASGFVLKDTEPAELIRAVTVVAAGDALLSPSVTQHLIDRLAALETRQASQPLLVLPPLTRREHEVLVAVASGLSNAEISGRLLMSYSTVKTHVSHLLTKLEARDRIQLAVLAHRAGLAEPVP
jgi:DNA-binding NarL/FixJ family response regulator